MGLEKLATGIGIMTAFIPEAVSSNEPVSRIILLRGFAHFGKFGIEGCVLKSYMALN